MFGPGLRRFAGILIDLTFDHLLHRYWQQLRATVPVADFNNRVYAVLADGRSLMSESAVQMAERLVEYDLLSRYAEWDAIPGQCSAYRYPLPTRQPAAGRGRNAARHASHRWRAPSWISTRTLSNSVKSREIDRTDHAAHIPNHQPADPRRLYHVTMIIVYYLDGYLGLEPCPLCMTQRVFVVGCGGLAILAILHNPARTGVRIYAALSALSAAIGGGVAIRHIWLQNLPEDQVACLRSQPGIHARYPASQRDRQAGDDGRRQLRRRAVDIPGAQHPRAGSGTIRRAAGRECSGSCCARTEPGDPEMLDDCKTNEERWQGR